MEGPCGFPFVARERWRSISITTPAFGRLNQAWLVSALALFPKRNPTRICQPEQCVPAQDAVEKLVGQHAWVRGLELASGEAHGLRIQSTEFAMQIAFRIAMEAWKT